MSWTDGDKGGTNILPHKFVSCGVGQGLVRAGHTDFLCDFIRVAFMILIFL